MHCLRLSRSEPFYTCFQTRNNLTCILHGALAIIAVCGFVLSVCAIVSYLPPRVGYGGITVCIASLTTLIICSLVSRRSTPALDPPLTNLSKKKQAQPTSITHSCEVLPDELYINIFGKLDEHDLLIASQVCKRWNRLASDNQLWEYLCLKETIAPGEDSFLGPYDYQELYFRSKALNCKIRTIIPKEQHTLINSLKSQSNPQAFLKVKDRVFLYMGDTAASCRFEMWDTSLNTCFFSASTYELYSPQIKWMENSIYLIGRSDVSWRQLQPPHNIFYVYSYEFIDDKITFHSKWIFEAKKNWAMPCTQFELGKDKAFIGLRDGQVDIIDLMAEGIRYEENDTGKKVICYPELSNWDLENECIWQASFAKKGRKIVEEILEDGEWKSIWMEEGEYERRLMYKRRNNDRAIRQRKQLIGHTKAITALRIIGNYLFSSSEDGTIKQWDLSNCTCVQTIDTECKTVCCFLRVLGRYVFGLEYNNKRIIYQWDFITKKCLYEIDLGKECHSFNVVGNMLFCLCNKEKIKTIEIYDLNTKKFIKTLTYGDNAWTTQFHIV